MTAQNRKASISRRELLALVLAGTALGQDATGPLKPEDDAFLDELERANVRFFWEQANPETGLVKDRCHVRGDDYGIVSSIASTGFGLTALCIGEKRGYIPTAEARQRVLTTLRFLWKAMPNHRGFYYHFANIKTGERIWQFKVGSGIISQPIALA